MQQFKLDPKIVEFGDRAYDTPLIKDVWKKYFWPKSEEKTPEEVYRRVAKAIANSPAEPAYHGDARPIHVEEAFYEMMSKRLFLPGGRILAGAGTDKRVTLMNCYVNETLEDSMEGIMAGVSHLALTSQQGGGMGTAFETLRPKDAILYRTQSAASGVLPFMDVFNQTGKTIRSAGERRAAQMGTISDTHPDLPEYIRAKGEGLKDGTERLKEFNVSVLVSDAFKAAVEDDEEWLLYFSIPPVARDKSLETLDFVDDNGVQQYVYSVWRARELWDLITEYTYEFSDPGVIFIDRINELNNLYYCEEIRCTNPCGEQPLPPNGTCNLGAINVANCVRKPFTNKAEVDYELLAEVAKWGVRFLDNVIDVTAYPLEAQKEEEFNKRRIGLGILGLGTLFSELQIKYGSRESIDVAEKVMKTIAISAYRSSIELARERGTFPYFDEAILDAEFIKNRMPEDIQKSIAAHGLRNGVILTIAPVGTGSIAFGSLSSGLEPDFDLEYERSVRKNNTEEFDKYIEKAYTKRFYEFCTGQTQKPDYMATAYEIEILDHIKIQGTLQKWVDASVSKTINIPEDYPYDKFVEVYDLAYLYGCKGCTTYRPSKWRGNILTSTSSKTKQDAAHAITLNGNGKRPDILAGNTYKVKWPSMTSSMFITINYDEHGKPYEIFFASKDAKYTDWMTGITLMISSLLRSGMNPAFIPRELKQVISAHDTSWHNGKFVGSLVARIGGIIEEDFIAHGIIQVEPQISLRGPEDAPLAARRNDTAIAHRGDICSSCGAPTLYHKEGCKLCSNCGYSSC